MALALLAGACAGPRPAPPQGTTATVVVPAPAQDSAAAFVGVATAMLGQPYRYGGTAPGGFDCSGLVTYAARGAGLALPRTTQEQLGAGAPVARGQLQAGDLVFMHLGTKELHVGIALDGQRIVHAPSTGGVVRIDQLDREPYARGYFAARRLAFPPAAAPRPAR